LAPTGHAAHDFTVSVLDQHRSLLLKRFRGKAPCRSPGIVYPLNPGMANWDLGSRPSGPYTRKLLGNRGELLVGIVWILCSDAMSLTISNLHEHAPGIVAALDTCIYVVLEPL